MSPQFDGKKIVWSQITFEQISETVMNYIFECCYCQEVKCKPTVRIQAANTESTEAAEVLFVH